LLSDGITNYVYGPTGAVIEQFGAAGVNPSFYFSDAHRSTTEIMSATGAVVGTYAYGAWGTVSSHSGASTPIQFAASYADAETGFLYLQARYYDPSTGLFTSVDALVARTLAAYTYSANNPLNKFDPQGRSTWGTIFGGLAVVVGVVGLVLSFSGAGTGVGLLLDLASFALSAAATNADCSEKRDVTCAIDMATLGFGVLGGLASGITHGAQIAMGLGEGIDRAANAINVGLGTSATISGVREFGRSCGMDGSR
jgi:RHS repeat-associated protein